MHIRTLELRAFGPFTGHTFDFGAGPGLHIVYGPNEAGKSSTLRAIGALLFGIDMRTPDDFVHPYNKLRIAAVLGDNTGDTLAVVRRKGRDMTLRDADDDGVVPESAIARLMGGAREETFRGLFHLDHARLVAGGRQMLEDRGALGEKLVAAAGADPAAVLDALEKESEAIFSPRRAPNKRFYIALAAYEAAREDMTRLTASADAWDRLDREIREARWRAGMN
jgi:uncharacterized protein YhaN